MRAQTVIPMMVQQMVCTGCGAEANASCSCGKPYVPKKQRAAEAIAANPRKSNVAIAEELGIDEKTVRKARQASDQSEPEREGRDGKVYRLPSKPHASDPIQEECEDCDTPQEHWQRSVSNMAGDAVSMSAFWSREFGRWDKFEVPSPLATLVKQAAAAWTKLATDLAKRRDDDEA